MRIHNKTELKNIAITHSADVDYKDLMKIYREYTSKKYSFQTIDNTLPADDSLRFRRNFLESYKMTLADKVKTLED